MSKTVDRVFTIWESVQNQPGITVTELQKVMSRDRPASYRTVSRILKYLCGRGLVFMDDTLPLHGNRYYPIFELKRCPKKKCCQPTLKRTGRS